MMRVYKLDGYRTLIFGGVVLFVVAEIPLGVLLGIATLHGVGWIVPILVFACFLACVPLLISWVAARFLGTRPYGAYLLASGCLRFMDMKRSQDICPQEVVRIVRILRTNSYRESQNPPRWATEVHLAEPRGRASLLLGTGWFLDGFRLEHERGALILAGRDALSLARDIADLNPAVAVDTVLVYAQPSPF